MNDCTLEVSVVQFLNSSLQVSRGLKLDKAAKCD